MILAIGFSISSVAMLLWLWLEPRSARKAKKACDAGIKLCPVCVATAERHEVAKEKANG